MLYFRLFSLVHIANRYGWKRNLINGSHLRANFKVRLKCIHIPKSNICYDLYTSNNNWCAVPLIVNSNRQVHGHKKNQGEYDGEVKLYPPRIIIITNNVLKHFH